MKKVLLLLAFFIVGFSVYSQTQKNVIDVMIECYDDYFALNRPAKSSPAKITPAPRPVCPPEPSNFYAYFRTDFIDFAALREGSIRTFSFSDSLHAPLKQQLLVTSAYGIRERKKHFGVDFRLAVRDTVYSVFCGKVRIAKWDDAYGYVVVVRNYNMSETVYAHLDSILVKADQEIMGGKPVGLGGNTGKSSGPHLHLELRYKGFPINPIVDDKFLKQLPVLFK